MPTFNSQLTVAASIEAVWDRFQDVETFLPALTPPEQGLEIKHALPLPPQVGTTLKMTMAGLFGRIQWTAKYVEFAPPHGTITGTEARFVDEQTTGPFKRWTHTHEFVAVDSQTTRCIDHIDYAAPLGPLGWIADLVFIRRKLRKTFAYRDEKMLETFGKAANV